MSQITAPKIVVTNPIHAEVLARLKVIGNVEMNPSVEPWGESELATRMSDADAMMGFMTDCVDEKLIGAAPRLKIVACALKGYDNYDVDACTSAGVWVSIVPDLLTEPTAELAIGLAIGLARNVLPGHALVSGGEFGGWRSTLYGTGLANSTVAIVGAGAVGEAIAVRLQGFGYKTILGVDPKSQSRLMTMVSLDEALSQSRFVFLAAPLNRTTHHMIDTTALEHARSDQFIINVGRGSVVDEAAIADALTANRISGYAADVFEMEDWGLSGRPREVCARLLAHPRTLFTPHLGSAVSEVRIAIEHRAVDNIEAVLSGKKPPDAINSVEVRAREVQAA